MDSRQTPAALKEWAVICDALAAGRQAILFRKGGIHEGPDGFRPEHSGFWLFPTGFHQSVDGVRPEFRVAAAGILQQPREPGLIPLQFFSTIRSVHWIEEESHLAKLQPFHVQTEEALARRFHYRRPGVFVLVVETRQLPEPVIVPNDPRYDGCHSWVMLNSPQPVDRLLPVREDVSQLATQADRVLLR